MGDLCVRPVEYAVIETAISSRIQNTDEGQIDRGAGGTRGGFGMFLNPEAEQVDTRNSDDPFTTFAPTNDAFDTIPPKILDAVLADKDLLTSVLTYHIVGADLSAEDLGKAKTWATVEGGEIIFDAEGATVNDANETCSNVPATNGTVHIIDGFLIPN